MPIGLRCFPDTPRGRARALRLFVGLRQRFKRAKMIMRRPRKKGRTRMAGPMICVTARIKTKNRKRFTFAGTRRRRRR
jgi:hypothetical protein